MIRSLRFASLFALFLMLMPLPGRASDETTSTTEVKSLDELHLPKVEVQPWQFREFPILGWWAPPGTARQEDFDAYRDAGFTLHPTNPDTSYDQAMEKAAKAGVKSMVFRERQGFILPKGDVDFSAYPDQIAGWITKDEPGDLPAVVDAVTAVNTLMRQDPSRWAIFNLLPPYAQKDPSTTEVLEAAVRNGMPVLSYDHYVINKAGDTAEQAHYDHLDLFRKASLQYEKPFWAFALTIGHFNYRRPSESDVRWEQFTNLAYGAKGLWYFTYWGPTDWDNWDKVAIVDSKDGSKTELYEHVKAINQAVLAMGDVLLGLKNLDVFHSDPPAGQRLLPKGKFWIADMAAQKGLVSFFEDGDGTEYAMVVNTRHGMDMSAAETSDTITLTFAPDVKGITAVNWLDGTPGPLEIRDGKAVLPVMGGTGVLLTRAE